MSAQERLTDDEGAKPSQPDNYDRDSLEEFVAKEAEVAEETEKSSANAYIDIDGTQLPNHFSELINITFYINLIKTSCMCDV